ncbi:hypothetical protein [Corynebacterium sp.]|uniref:hypothetical protein n=1 Tax=Corynebacterium sp. TaxID=1720 RepID=UPI0026DB1067|nr:hypothetical protein [Corynebacterium sp.]MDO5031284.1 hypothetical protein [Corynebacterium sp.]
MSQYEESQTTRLLLFMSALGPALMIAGIRIYEFQHMLSVVVFISGFVALLPTPIVLAVRRKAGTQAFTVSSIKDESSQVPTYVITFIFPFLFISEAPSPPLIASYTAFALLVLLLLYRTSLALINPLLLLCGYHIFSADVREQGTIFLISKKTPLPSALIYTKRITNGLFITVDTPQDKPAQHLK